MSPCFSQMLRFDPGSSIKLLSTKRENTFFPSMVRFYPAGILSSVPIRNVSVNASAPPSPYKHLLEPQRNVLVNISHSSCTCNGDRVGLLIKTGSIQKKK